MCGIFLFVSRDPQLVDETVDILEPLLKNRGPNCTNRLTIALETKENVVLHVTFVGSVLWLRGGSLLPQPYVDSEGNVLLWNGDVFESEILGDDDSVSDTKLLGDALENASEETLIKVHIHPWKDICSMVFNKWLFSGHIRSRRPLRIYLLPPSGWPAILWKRFFWKTEPPDR